MYKDVTDKFKEDSMMCAGGSDRDACQVNFQSSDNLGSYVIQFLKFVTHDLTMMFILNYIISREIQVDR